MALGMALSDKPPTDKLQELFFQQWWADLSEGVTLRSLHRAFHDHVRDDESRFREVDGRLSTNAAEAAWLDGHVTATGSHIVPEIKSKRSSWPIRIQIDKKQIAWAIGKGAAAIALVLGGWLMRHCSSVETMHYDTTAPPVPAIKP